MTAALDTFIKALQDEAEAKAKASITAERVEIDRERQDFQRKLNAMADAREEAGKREAKMRETLAEVAEQLEEFTAQLRLAYLT